MSLTCIIIDLEVILYEKYNLIVVGGGLTGVAAAVAAARQNLSVLLVEQGGYLGGAMANGLIYPFMRFWTQVDGQTKWLSAGLFTEMRNRCYAYLEGMGPGNPTEGPSFAHFNVANGPGDYNTEFFKYALDDMVEEAGVD